MEHSTSRSGLSARHASSGFASSVEGKSSAHTMPGTDAPTHREVTRNMDHGDSTDESRHITIDSMPNKKQLLIDIDPDLHLAMKRHALENGKTLRETVITALEEYLKREQRVDIPKPKRGKAT